MLGLSRKRKQVVKKGAPRVRAAPFRCRLVVMAKAPVAGQVKTRLARELGVATATRFARQATGRPAGAVCRAAGPGIRRWPSHPTPPRPGPSGHGVWRGCGRAEATSVRACSASCRSTPPGPVVIIGSDVPGIRSTHIAQAFRLLGGHDAVFGPASDGGYWLVGLRRRPRLLRPFDRVRWSTEHALTDTLANLNSRSIGQLPTLSDVDDARDFTSTAARFGRRVTPPYQFAARTN